MHVIVSQQSRGEQSKGERGRGANFGCMACGVRITIFSAALLYHSVCSITIYCREREAHREEREREGRGKGKNKGNGRKGGGGGGGAVLSDAGDEKVDVKELERIEGVQKQR